MTLQVELWQIVTLLISFFGACTAAGGLLLRQTQRHLDERFSTQEAGRAEFQRQLDERLRDMERSGHSDSQEWQRVERDMLKRFAQLPHDYVMRDDYIRGQSIIEAKLDGLASKLDQARMRLLNPKADIP